MNSTLNRMIGAYLGLTRFMTPLWSAVVFYKAFNKRWLLELIVSLCLLFGVSQKVYAQSYTASGNCFYTNYDAKGSAQTVINASFSTTVENAKVYMRLNFAPDYYEEWSYDGITSYCLLDSPDRVNPAKGSRAAVTIKESEFPITAVCLLRTIWLGLCSAHYFNNSSNQPILVPWGDWGLTGMLSFRWKVENFKAAPYLPSNIVFTASSDLWAKEQSMRIDQRGTFTFHDGFVGGEFEATQTQSYDRMTLPLSFILKRYRAGKFEGKLLEFYSIQVTNITGSASESFIPKIQRATDVSDMRDETIDMPRFGITYTLTNDNWLAKSDLRRLALVEAKKPIYWSWRHSIELKSAGVVPASAEQHPIRRITMIIVLALSVISLPIGRLIYFKMSQKNKNK